MAPLHGFKMLATKCTVAGSPTRSPTASPVIHLRRRKTLRMLLSRADGGGGRTPPQLRRESSPDRMGSTVEESSPEKAKELSISRKLKDLFVSSPPGLEDAVVGGVRMRWSPATGVGAGGVSRRAARSRRSLPSALFRRRLLRRAWRPLLVAIPE